MYDSNSDLGYKFAFYRYVYNIYIFCTMNLKTLLDYRSGYINIDGFTIDDVKNLIYTLSID